MPLLRIRIVLEFLNFFMVNCFRILNFFYGDVTLSVCTPGKLKDCLTAVGIEPAAFDSRRGFVSHREFQQNRTPEFYILYHHKVQDVVLEYFKNHKSPYYYCNVHIK